MTAHHSRHAGGAPAEGFGAGNMPVIALVGRPNVGKSTFLSRASGTFVETANAPGTTLVAERRLIRLDRARRTRIDRLPRLHRPAAERGCGGQRPSGGNRPVGEAWLVDLPGTASLVDRPAGDDLFWHLLVAERPDAILVVADAGDIGRHVPLVLACRDLGLPVVVAANLADEAEARGVELDTGALSQLLAAPVHLTTGRTGEGVAPAVEHAVRLARQRRRVRAEHASPRGTVPASPYPIGVELELTKIAQTTATRSLGAAALAAGTLNDLVADGVVSARGAATIEMADALEPIRWHVATRWAARVERHIAASPADASSRHRAERVAQLATAPWPGLPLFAGVTVASFLVMIAVGGWLSAVLGTAWSTAVTPVVTAVIHALVPQAAIANSLLWGVDGGLIALISVGIPYVLTFYVLLAILEDSGYLTSAAVLTDRLFNIVGLPGRAAIPLLAASGCNVPAIYGTRVLATRRERLIGSFLVTMTPCSARSAVVIAALAPFAGPGAALAAFGVVVALTVAGGIAANHLVPGRQPALVLELAPLRRPLARQVLGKAWTRFRDFVRSAAPVMFVGSIVLGALYETGLVWPVAGLADPVVRGWLGLPTVAGLALVFAFLRKELALQLLVALAVVEYGAGAASLGSFMTPPQLFVYAVVTSVSVPCVATLAALASEFGWRSALIMSGATLGIALGAGGVLARLLGTA